MHAVCTILVCILCLLVQRLLEYDLNFKHACTTIIHVQYIVLHAYIK